MFKKMKCIYCLEYKPKSSYKKTEHVMPRSFGLFKNNLTLNSLVCDDCNQYFGDNLEIDLARDTFEGQSRFEFNIKKDKDYKSAGKNSRIKIRIMDGPLKGTYAYREYSCEKKAIVFKPLPQVGFRRKDTSEYDFFLLPEIPDKSFLEEKNYDMKHPKAIRAFGIDDNQLEILLREKNIQIKHGGEFILPSTPQKILCDVEGEIDRCIFRAVAKISFNYLAYWHSSNFVYQSDFDNARRFIRFGEKPTCPIVAVAQKPILADEPIEGKRRLGHLVTLNWAIDQVSVISQVSLFNGVTYVVCLSRNYSGERRDIRKGHFFNTKSMTIYDLEARQKT